MRKLSMVGLCLLAAAGCARAVPDDTRPGVGFSGYTPSRAVQTEIAPEETVLPPAEGIEALASAAIAEAEGTVPAGPVIALNNPGMSDEQDFQAVAARESIESDAERRARMQQERVIVQPTAVPERPRSTGPNIIEYAVSTSNPLGNRIYNRFPLGQGRHERNCLAYRSDDLAQEAFLEMGGPERDRQALDPDGDGYACGWNPEVYRQAALAARSE